LSDYVVKLISITRVSSVLTIGMRLTVR